MKLFKSILIVDDDPISNYMTSYFLKRSGICNRISICKNGEEALAFMEENQLDPPDLLLLDIHMPVMDGIEFLEKVNTSRINRQKTKIIIHTINSKDIIKEKATYGLEIIDKPLTMDKFFQAIGEPWALGG